MRFYLLGEAQALSLVVQVTLLNGLDLLLLLLLSLSGLLDGLGLLGSLVLNDGSGLGGDNGCLVDRLGLDGSLNGRSRDASGGKLRLGLLRDLDVLLFLGHFERFKGVSNEIGYHNKQRRWYKKGKKKGS